MLQVFKLLGLYSLGTSILLAILTGFFILFFGKSL
jgi:hypothetical protein